MKFLAILSALIFAPFMAPGGANAVPGQCISTPWGGFCDSPYVNQNGSFWHCENAMGFSNCYNACLDQAGRPYPC